MTKPRLVCALAGTLAVVGILTFLLTAGPVILAFSEASSPSSEPAWSLMNPFRDRGPERAADEFLRHLRDGDPTVELTSVPNVSPQVISRELEIGLVDWRLVWREDSDNRSRLLFRVRRDDDSAIETPVRMTIRLDSSGAYKVSEYSAIY